MRCSYGTKRDDTVAEVSDATCGYRWLLLTICSWTEICGSDISAAGDGTYNLSVEITHGTGEGSYFVTLVRINDNTKTRQAYMGLYLRTCQEERSTMWWWHGKTWGKSWSPSRHRPSYPARPSTVYWNLNVSRSPRISAKMEPTACMWRPHVCLIKENFWLPWSSQTRPGPGKNFVISKLAFRGCQGERSMACKSDGGLKRRPKRPSRPQSSCYPKTVLYNTAGRTIIARSTH